MCCLDVTLMSLFLIGSHGEQSSAAVVTLERVQDFETLSLYSDKAPLETEYIRIYSIVIFQ